LGGDLRAFEDELRLAELFTPGTAAGLLHLLQDAAPGDQPARRIAERITAG
jgi:hypothetical protein